MPIAELNLKSISNKPGVYRFYDAQDQLLYVGKAKNLVKRVRSYFSKTHDSARLRLLVSKIHRVSTLEVANEYEALLLENNLIKTLKPRYNVNLRDDKTYPWLIITQEAFPRIFPIRRKTLKGEYFGPYASVKHMYTVLEFINRNFPLRSCKLDLSAKALEHAKHRPCLDFHIGRCKAPCALLQNEAAYLISVQRIRNLLKGKTALVIKELRLALKQATASLEFERAQQIKQQVDALAEFHNRSIVVSTSVKQVEVCHFAEDEQGMMLQYFYIDQGAIIQAQHLYLERKLDETRMELFMLGLTEIRQRFNVPVKEIWVAAKPDQHIPNIRWYVPQKGENLKVLELCYQNARKHLVEKHLNTKPKDEDSLLLQRMQHELRLKNLPRRIEAFDNSHLQGTFTVSAMPVFINGKPEPSAYRVFNITSAAHADDYASMREAVYRRYKRCLAEDQPLPDLIVIDGGKGQLQAACESLVALDIFNRVDVLGLAKRLEEVFIPGISEALYLNRRSPVLKTLQHIRDEAHRFGLQHHRNRRSKAQYASLLDNIAGIGPKTADAILIRFGSIEAFKVAPYEAWVSCVGKSKAAILKIALRQ